MGNSTFEVNGFTLECLISDCLWQRDDGSFSEESQKDMRYLFNPDGTGPGVFCRYYPYGKKSEWCFEPGSRYFSSENKELLDDAIRKCFLWLKEQKEDDKEPLTDEVKSVAKSLIDAAQIDV